MSWGIIKNNPNRPKNMMSFPLEDPIKNKCVTGLIIGLKISVMNIMPANIMKANPIKIVLLAFINNNLIINSLNKLGNFLSIILNIIEVLLLTSELFPCQINRSLQILKNQS